MSESADDSQVRKLLQESRTIAVVGCSNSPGKPSNTVPTYMLRQGYRILPVNPNHSHILGQKAYARLEDISEKIDIVDVFRPSEEAASIAASAVKLKPKAVWLQLGIKSEDAAKIAEGSGIMFVQDRCIKIEYQRLIRR